MHIGWDGYRSCRASLVLDDTTMPESSVITGY